MNFLDDRLPPRFWSKCIPEPNSGCWLWVAAPSRRDGYAQFWISGTRKNEKRAYVHRVAYEALVGPIPRGLQVDHLCRNTLCCNPAHLEPVTRSVNISRGLLGREMGCLRHRNAMKTHCKDGHEFTLENTYFSPAADGSKKRNCLICKRAKEKRNRRRRNEALRALNGAKP